MRPLSHQGRQSIRTTDIFIARNETTDQMLLSAGYFIYLFLLLQYYGDDSGLRKGWGLKDESKQFSPFPLLPFFSEGGLVGDFRFAFTAWKILSVRKGPGSVIG
jgi:hypothetical protein